MQFYSLKHRKLVSVSNDALRKRRMQRSLPDGRTQERYAITAETVVDGATVKLSKFVNRAAFDALKAPEIT